MTGSSIDLSGNLKTSTCPVSTTGPSLGDVLRTRSSMLSMPVVNEAMVVAMSYLSVTGASKMLCQTASSVKKAARTFAPFVPKEAREVKRQA